MVANLDKDLNYILKFLDCFLHLQSWDFYVDAKPTSNYCASHGLNNCGKRFFDSARYAETFIKLWQPVVMFSGYARSLAASKFNEEVKTSGGIRFLAKVEQSFQIFKAGLKTKNIDEIIPF